MTARVYPYEKDGVLVGPQKKSAHHLRARAHNVNTM